MMIPDMSSPTKSSPTKRAAPQTSRSPRATLQPLVRGLMKTLLEDYPELLDESAALALTDSEYCRNELGLQIGRFALLRRRQDGRIIKGYGRYWNEVFGDHYVVSQWGKKDHAHNAERLLQWVEQIIRVTARQPGRVALQRHRTALARYLG